jgi:hypothetical protein
MPPMYNENFDQTSLDRYDVVFGANPSISPTTIGYLAQDTAAKYQQLRLKIERAKELQCAQIFTDGIVVLKNNDSIDFKRKNTSIVDLTGAGGYWTTTATDIEAQLIAAGTFIRTKGKNATSEFHLITSGTQWINLKKSDYFKNTANYQQVQLLDIPFPVKNSTGQSFMGRIVAGAYIFNVWCYDEIYENASGVATRYWDEKKAVVLPATGYVFDLAHGGVPAIIRDTTRAEFPEYIANQSAEYWLNNYIDNKAKSHTFEIYSAPLAIPVTVDQIYTMKTSA